MTTYTLSIFTTNTIGLLNRITIIFTRRRLNIESLTVCETERKGVSRFTIVMRHESRDAVEKLVRQIRKVVDVLAVFGYLDHEIVFNEIALFKLATPLGGTPLNIKEINLDWNAKVVHWGLDCRILSIYEKLGNFGIPKIRACCCWKNREGFGGIFARRELGDCLGIEKQKSRAKPDFL
jgi:acetolactate synthase small subunit